MVVHCAGVNQTTCTSILIILDFKFLGMNDSHLPIAILLAQFEVYSDTIGSVIAILLAQFRPCKMLRFFDSDTIGSV